MDANQRSEVNNQTNNGANEKWTPGSKGKIADNGQPLDHTYPQGSTQQMGNQGLSDPGTGQSGAGPVQRGDAMGQYEVAGGSMQNQVDGGSGAVGSITDSHQRQMEQKSGAYGLLEQPVGHRAKDSGVDVNVQRDTGRDGAYGEPHVHGQTQPYAPGSDFQEGSFGQYQGNVQSGDPLGNTQGGGMAGPQGSLPPHAPAGSMGNRQSGMQSGTQSGNQSGNFASTQGGGMAGPHTGAQAGQEAEAGNTQLGVTGSASMANQNSDYGGVHESNDTAGGLPRSPGGTGARHSASSTDRIGSQTGPGGAESGPQMNESNDASGHYPRSPGYANRLAGDRNMDDDTGFKRKR
jgi:hypothetical protein